MRIDDMQDGERAAVEELVRDTYVGEGYVDAGNPYARVLTDVEARRTGADVLVARTDDGSVVGTVTFCLAGSPWANIAKPGEAEFRMLAVQPAARGSGVGRLLVQECVHRAHAAGASALVLSTSRDMVTAHRLYERMGFVRSPERDWSPHPDETLMTYRYSIREVT